MVLCVRFPVHRPAFPDSCGVAADRSFAGHRKGCAHEPGAEASSRELATSAGEAFENRCIRCVRNGSDASLATRASGASCSRCGWSILYQSRARSRCRSDSPVSASLDEGSRGVTTPQLTPHSDQATTPISDQNDSPEPQGSRRSFGRPRAELLGGCRSRFAATPLRGRCHHFRSRWCNGGFLRFATKPEVLCHRRTPLGIERRGDRVVG
jgi:DNA-directed RNA polymerase subunit RPC12/RpoP